jgi:hypothetical protein
MGLAWSRYVIHMEPLASAPLHEVAERVAPELERMMLGAAPPDAPEASRSAGPASGTGAS